MLPPWYDIFGEKDMLFPHNYLSLPEASRHNVLDRFGCSVITCSLNEIFRLAIESARFGNLFHPLHCH